MAAYPGSNGRIAFVSKGNIFTIRPSGKGLTKLTSLGHASGPRWSPNGAKLAYLYRGNLWIMNADGSGKTRITAAAPRYTDGRATWSPNGRYLAFVKTQAGRAFGYLTRYDTVTHRFVTFTGSISGPHVDQIQALPGTAVAWQWARNAGLRADQVHRSRLVPEPAGLRYPGADHRGELPGNAVHAHRAHADHHLGYHPARRV